MAVAVAVEVAVEVEVAGGRSPCEREEEPTTAAGGGGGADDSSWKLVWTCTQIICYWQLLCYLVPHNSQIHTQMLLLLTSGSAALRIHLEATNSPLK